MIGRFQSKDVRLWQRVCAEGVGGCHSESVVGGGSDHTLVQRSFDQVFRARPLEGRVQVAESPCMDSGAWLDMWPNPVRGHVVPAQRGARWDRHPIMTPLTNVPGQRKRRSLSARRGPRGPECVGYALCLCCQGLGSHCLSELSAGTLRDDAFIKLSFRSSFMSALWLLTAARVASVIVLGSALSNRSRIFSSKMRYSGWGFVSRPTLGQAFCQIMTRSVSIISMVFP